MLIVLGCILPIMQKWWLPTEVCLLIGCIILCGCTSPVTPVSLPTSPPVTPVTSPNPVSSSPGGLTLDVALLEPGSVLPDRYSCKGAGDSPGVSWDGIPSGTKSLVLIIDDPDAPAGTFTHWIVYNIPPEKGSLARGQPNAKVLANGAQQGDTSAGSRGYYPVCPPIGTTHRYVFRLYAVDMDITQPTAGRDSIDWALEGHTISRTVVTTTFKR